MEIHVNGHEGKFRYVIKCIDFFSDRKFGSKNEKIGSVSISDPGVYRLTIDD
jgi:hypothetical protein